MLKPASFPHPESNDRLRTAQINGHDRRRPKIQLAAAIRTRRVVNSGLVVRRSPVHGIGVFTTVPIRKGARIIEYSGRRVPWSRIPDDSEDGHTFLFGINNGADVIDPTVGGNDARWINHSCEPNCEAIEDDRGRVFIHALRYICPGEELLYDYQLEVDKVTDEAKNESRCFCGASNCRGTMLAT